MPIEKVPQSGLGGIDSDAQRRMPLRVEVHEQHASAGFCEACGEGEGGDGLSGATFVGAHGNGVNHGIEVDLIVPSSAESVKGRSSARDAAS